MAVLGPEPRRRVGNQFMRENGAPLGLTKPQLRLTVDAIDDWIEANQASLVAALPAAARPAQGNLSAAQLVDLFCLVAQRRANRLRTEEDG